MYCTPTGIAYDRLYDIPINVEKIIDMFASRSSILMET